MAGAGVCVGSSDMSSAAEAKRYFIRVDGERLNVDNGCIDGIPMQFFCRFNFAAVDDSIKTKKIIPHIPIKKLSTTFVSPQIGENVPGPGIRIQSGKGDGESRTSCSGEENQSIRSDVSEMGSERTVSNDTDSLKLTYEPNNKSIQRIEETAKLDIDFCTIRIIEKWMSRAENQNYFNSKLSFDARFGQPNYLHDVLFALNPRVLLEELIDEGKNSREIKTKAITDNELGEISSIKQVSDRDQSNDSFKILCDIPLLSKREKRQNSLKLLPKGYLPEEDKIIIKWVLENNNAVKVNGTELWKRLEKNEIMPYVRSWQSLRNRFLKSILYNLRNYGLSDEQEKRLLVGAEKGVMKKCFQNLHNSPKRKAAKLPDKNCKLNIKNTQDEDNVYSIQHIANDDNLKLPNKIHKARNIWSLNRSNKLQSEDIGKRKLFTRRSYLSSEHS